jgi:hypothetical protein
MDCCSLDGPKRGANPLCIVMAGLCPGHLRASACWMDCCSLDGPKRGANPLCIVMAGLVPAIYALQLAGWQGVDARDKRGHDEVDGPPRSMLRFECQIALRM